MGSGRSFTLYATQYQIHVDLIIGKAKDSASFLGVETLRDIETRDTSLSSGTGLRKKAR